VPLEPGRWPNLKVLRGNSHGRAPKNPKNRPCQPPQSIPRTILAVGPQMAGGRADWGWHARELPAGGADPSLSCRTNPSSAVVHREPPRVQAALRAGVAGRSCGPELRAGVAGRSAGRAGPTTVPSRSRPSRQCSRARPTTRSRAHDSEPGARPARSKRATGRISYLAKLGDPRLGFSTGPWPGRPARSRPPLDRILWRRPAVAVARASFGTCCAGRGTVAVVLCQPWTDAADLLYC
jgi:hypothetical protein